MLQELCSTELRGSQYQFPHLYLLVGRARYIGTIGNKYAQHQDITQIASLQNNLSFMYNFRANDMQAKAQLKLKRSTHDILVFYIKEISKCRHRQRDIAPFGGKDGGTPRSLEKSERAKIRFCHKRRIHHYAIYV